MDKRTLLGRKAMRGALDSRRRVGCTFNQPICVYDLAEQLGISVWFQGGGSFGGMYSKTANALLVPSLRPAARQAFTCAHEIGHWYYGHGTKLDVYVEKEGCGHGGDDDEFLVDLFAGHLLMPIGAVSRAFTRRGVDPNTCTPFDLYCVAAQLGVGYTTLLNHMLWTQGRIAGGAYETLKKYSPKGIRADLLGFMDEDPGYLVVADEHWEGVPIDLQVGQVAMVPRGVVSRGKCVECIKGGENANFFIAVKPGISVLSSVSGWESFIRVSRKDFEGRSIYRHLEEFDDE